MKEEIIFHKAHLIALLAMLQVWPIHTTIKAVQHAHRFHEIFDDLLGNASLPSISSFYFETYRLWILVPILTVMLTLICSHRRISTATLPIIAAALTILLTYAMNQIMTEAIYAPFRTITTSLGKQDAEPCGRGYGSPAAGSPR